jgi:hypothetical protein
MRWTKDRLEWLIKSKEIYNDREDILNAFNKYFNVNVSLALLSKNNYKYKLDLPRATRIITRCLEMGWVKRRGFSRRDSDYTQEYVNGNRTFIKIDNAKTKDGFVPKHRYLYEKYHNIKLDDIDDVIIFLDNDHTNFSKENLYLVKRKTHALYLNHRLHKVKSVDKLALIKYCEWKENIIELKRGKGNEESKI